MGKLRIALGRQFYSQVLKKHSSGKGLHNSKRLHNETDKYRGLEYEKTGNTYNTVPTEAELRNKKNQVRGLNRLKKRPALQLRFRQLNVLQL